MPGIFVQKKDGSLVEMHEDAYEKEDVLQKLLEDYPALLSGESNSSEDGRRFILVKREAGVPEVSGGTDRWSIDHVFLDDEGVPTLVEVKRSSDTRIRREVVGQMFDYAANIVAHWPVERIRTEFETKREAEGADPLEEIASFSGQDPEEFWQRVKTNVEAQKLRLVFLADEIPPTLQTIVEFLNGQMRSTEVLALEVKRHAGEGMKTLVTRVVGRTSTARAAKSTGADASRTRWTEETFFEDLEQLKPSSVVEGVRELLGWTNRVGSLTWGAGVHGGASMRLQTGAIELTFSSIQSGEDHLYFHFKHLHEVPAFGEESARTEYFDRLSKVPGVSLPPASAVINGVRSVPLDILGSRETVSQLISVFGWLRAALQASS